MKAKVRYAMETGKSPYRYVKEDGTDGSGETWEYISWLEKKVEGIPEEKTGQRENEGVA